MAKKKKPEVGTPEDRKLIQHYAEELKKKVDSLGGIEDVQRRLELSTSIFYYHTLARKAGIDVEDVNATIEFILKLYREAIMTKGYKGLKSNMIPVVYYYGTIKDRTALCLQYFEYNRWEPNGKHPPVSRQTIDNVRLRIHKAGKKDVKEFLGYLAIYDAYTSITKHFLYTASVYFSYSYQAALYLQNYEWTMRTAELLTAIKPLIEVNSKDKAKAVKDFMGVIDKQNEYLNSNQRFGRLKILNGKVEDKEAFDCLDYAIFMANQAAEYLSSVKGIIEGIKEWTNEQEGNPYKSILMPQELREKVIEPDYFTSIDDVQDKYYKDHLKKMEEKGETITEYDKKIAIFPSYDSVEVDEAMKQQTIGKLNDTLQQRKSL